MLGELSGTAQRMTGIATFDDRGEVEDGKGYHMGQVVAMELISMWEASWMGKRACPPFNEDTGSHDILSLLS